jgi:hypothetical protein
MLAHTVHTTQPAFRFHGSAVQSGISVTTPSTLETDINKERLKKIKNRESVKKNRERIRRDPELQRQYREKQRLYDQRYSQKRKLKRLQPRSADTSQQ